MMTITGDLVGSRPRKSNMSRAALLPALVDPFLLKLWFQCFENVWQNEVDKVYISLSPRTDVGRKRVNKFIVEFMSKNPKIEIWENPTTSLIDQFKAPIEKCKEDIFVYVQ